MLYSYFFNMLKVGVPGATQVPQLLVYNQKTRKPNQSVSLFSEIFILGVSAALAACEPAGIVSALRGGLELTRELTEHTVIAL